MMFHMSQECNTKGSFLWTRSNREGSAKCHHLSLPQLPKYVRIVVTEIVFEAYYICSFIHHLPFCAEVAVGVGALAGWQHPLNGLQLIGRWMGIVCPAGSTIMLLTVPWFLVPWRDQRWFLFFLKLGNGSIDLQCLLGSLGRTSGLHSRKMPIQFFSKAHKGQSRNLMGSAGSADDGNVRV